MTQKINTANDQLLSDIESYIKKYSQFDPSRNYLGLSGLGHCPKNLYDKFFKGNTFNEQTFRDSYRGYHQEFDIIQMLQITGFARQEKPAEIVLPNAPSLYGISVKGHPDAVAFNGAVIEVKAPKREKFDRILKEKKLPMDWFSQGQAYMFYGGYKYCYFVIRCCETYRHYVHSKHYDLI